MRLVVVKAVEEEELDDMMVEQIVKFKDSNVDLQLGISCASCRGWTYLLLIVSCTKYAPQLSLESIFVHDDCVSLS
jgi:hypothetical protein